MITEKDFNTCWTPCKHSDKCMGYCPWCITEMVLRSVGLHAEYTSTKKTPDSPKDSSSPPMQTFPGHID